MAARAFSQRRWMFLGLLVIALGGGWWWWLWSHGHEAGGPLVLQGNVEVRQVNLGFKVAGRIKQLNVDEGDFVSEGQVLASLDKVYFEDSLNQVRAQREQSAANLAKMVAGNRPDEIAQAESLVAEREAIALNAKTTFDRSQQLWNNGAGSRKAYDDAIAAHLQAQAQLDSGRVALQLMKSGFRKEDIDLARSQLAERDVLLQITSRQLADAELKAPGPGMVLSRVREVGSIINAGETLYVLTLTNPIWVRAYVSEVDLGRIRPGQDVEILIDTPDVRPRRGHVGFISPTAEFTPKTVETRELRTALVYRVRIVAEDPDGVLRQGMPVSATLQPLTKSVEVQQR